MDPCPGQEQLQLFGTREEAGEQAYVLGPTHPAAVLTDFDDGLILPEIPHNCLATGVSRRQDVLDLAVPGKGFNVFWRFLRQDGERDNLPSPEVSDTHHFTPPSNPQGAQRRQEVAPTDTASGGGSTFFQEDALMYWYRSWRKHLAHLALALYQSFLESRVKTEK